jgi:hypothetical protein
MEANAGPEEQLARAKGVAYEVVDGKAVLVDPVGLELVTLNEVGTLVWEALPEHGDADSLAENLLSRLEGVSAEELRADIGAFLHELRDLGLVVPRAAG